MKPLTLSIEGINSFTDKQFIDFEALSGEGLFGVFGPTASGKSTIIDAITLALYGKISRYGGEHKYMFINKNVEKARLVFEFEIEGTGITEKYMIRKSYSAVRKSGKYELFEKSISRYTDGQYIPLKCEKEQDISGFVTKLTGLSFDDFTRSVVLPQGRFSDFLFLENKNRALMLERIFKLEEYGAALTDRVNQRANEIGARLDELSGRLTDYEGISKHGYIELVSKRDEMSKQSVILTEKSKQMNRVLNDWSAYSELNKELSGYEQEFYNLLSREKAIEEKSVKLNSAHKAAQLNDSFERSFRLREEYDLCLKNAAESEKLKKQSESLYQEIRDKYTAVLAEKEEKYPQLIERENKLKTAVELVKENAKTAEAIQDLKQKRDNLETTLSKINEDLEKSAVSQKTVLANKEASDKLKTRFMLILESREAVTRAAELENKVGELSEQLNALQKKENATAAEIIEQKNHHSETEKNLNDLKLQKTRLLAEKDELMERCPNQDEISDERIRLAAFTQELKELEKLCEEYNHALQDEKTYISEAACISEELTKFRTDEQLLDEAIQKGLDAIAVFKDANVLSILAARLNDGESCPVCGSKKHPNPARSVSSELLEALEKKKAEDEDRRDNVRLRLSELEILLAKSKHLLALTTEKCTELSAKIDGRDVLELRKEKSKQDEILSAIQNTAADITVKLADNQKRLDENDTEIRNAEMEAASLKEKLGANEKRAIEYQTEIKNSQDTLKNILSSLTALKAENNIDDVKRSYAEIRKADDEIKKINDFERKAAEHIEKMTAEKERLANEHNSKKTELAVVFQQLKFEEKSLADKLAVIAKITNNNAENELMEVSAAIAKLVDDEKSLKSSLNDKEKSAAEAANNLTILQTKREALQKELDAAVKEQGEKMLRLGFLTQAEAEAAKLPDIVINELEHEIEAFRSEKARLAEHLKRLTERLGGVDRNEIETKLAVIKTDFSELGAKVNSVYEELGRLTATAGEYEEKLKKYEELRKEADSVTALSDMMTELKALFRGNKFVEFIAAYKLRKITGEATRRLREMTKGRYALELNETDFIVRDDFNGGVRRAPKTLSGGESFIVSLCLALSLSSGIRGGARDGFFFLDEGFGTLDSDTLATVFEALTELTHDRVTIGLISHVSELKEKVPKKITLIPAGGGDGARII